MQACLPSTGPNINPACAVAYDVGSSEDGAPAFKRVAVEMEVAGEEVIVNDDTVEHSTESSDSGQASDDTNTVDNSSITDTASSVTGTASSPTTDKPKKGELV